jgi:hypothetical protein
MKLPRIFPPASRLFNTEKARAALNISVGDFIYEHFSQGERPFYLAMGFIVPAFLPAPPMVHEPEKKNNLSQASQPSKILLN